MNILLTIFGRAGTLAQKAYDTAIAAGKDEAEAREESKAEFYYGLFSFFFDHNLTKWKVGAK